MPSATNEHQHKRRFQQPDITSYFSRSTTSSTSSTSFRTAPTDQFAGRSSPLPPSAPVQSSLLNVGMRVRKSVPDGYRTAKTSNTITSKPSAGSYSGNQCRLTKPSSGNVTTTRAELTPFCGILKTGGYDSPSQWPSQSSSPSSSLDSEVEGVSVTLPQLVFDGEGIDGYDGPDFTSSQESNDSISTIPDTAPLAGMSGTNMDTLLDSRKRPFMSEEELQFAELLAQGREINLVRNREDNLAAQVQEQSDPFSYLDGEWPVDESEAQPGAHTSEVADNFDFGEAVFLVDPSDCEEVNELDMST